MTVNGMPHDGVQTTQPLGSSGEASMHHKGAKDEIRFQVTGCAAHTRLAPLVPQHWRNESPYHNDKENTTNIQQRQTPTIDFLWENAPRSETKSYRDHVKCYSHLPNGTSILDDKWVLARLFASHATTDGPDDNTPSSLAVLETHCFRGLEGFRSICNKLQLTTRTSSSNAPSSSMDESYHFPDILDKSSTTKKDHNLQTTSTKPPNMWVVKDAGSNGAGGIWVISPENVSNYLSVDTSPLLEDHRYVAQKYAWPPVLYGGKKCHVRVYGLLTSDGKAFVHKRAFLHVANDLFHQGDNPSNDEVHITNCCANSHKKEKFAGEICADFETNVFGDIHGQTVVPLQDFFPSVRASVSALAERTMPYLKGGEANHGFEYLGMDFILSYADNGEPVAYLLEVNAPPSQDTATGLSHAEHLHDDVIRDIISLWVLPSVTGVEAKNGGWRCVHNNNVDSSTKDRQDDSKSILPSKAAILNKIRWAIFERKASSNLEEILSSEETTTAESSSSSIKNNNNNNGKSHDTSSLPQVKESITADSIACYARSQFPYFENTPSSNATTTTTTTLPGQIFFENAGGSQVPRQVIESISRSLAHRHRCVIGSKAKETARNILMSLVGGDSDIHEAYLGQNASTLFELLARQYVRTGFLKKGDEVIICSENHLANTNPWVHIAKEVGAKVKWWSTTSLGGKVSCLGEHSIVSNQLEDLLSERTRIVAVSHASNILGQIRDIHQICCMAKERSQGYAHVIVDGVAAVPHIFPDISKANVDWYAVSCHKVFGPHLGCLVGKKEAVTQLCTHSFEKEAFMKSMEIGTINYEACAGVEGLGQYWRGLATSDSPAITSQTQLRQTRNQCTESVHDRDEDGRWRYTDMSARTAGTVHDSDPTMLSQGIVEEAYRRIHLAEKPLVDYLRKGLQAYNEIRIVESTTLPSMGKIPVVGFIHEEIPSQTIVEFCSKRGIICRSGTFLCTSLLLEEFLPRKQTSEIMEPSLCSNEIVRISLAHYNTKEEIEILMNTLESIPGW